MPPSRIEPDQRGARDDGEVAVAARELDERVAVPAARQRQGDAGEQLVRREARSSCSRPRTRRTRCPAARASTPRAALPPRSAVTFDELRGRIEMAQRSAERAAVARLAMPDVRERLVQDGTALGRPRPRTRGRAGASSRRLPARSSVTRRYASSAYPVEIDQVVRHRGRGNSASASATARPRARARSRASPSRSHGFGDGARIVVGERRGLHIAVLESELLDPCSTGVSGVDVAPRWRASVSMPFCSHSPAVARRAKRSQVSVQSPSV